MDKIISYFDNFKYKWVIMFILFFPFMKVSFFRTIPILTPIYDVFRWVFSVILLVLFIYKKKKPSKLLIGILVFEVYTFISSLICGVSNEMMIECIKDAVSVMSVAVFIELFIDDKQNLIKSLILNYEIAIYPNLISIIQTYDVPQLKKIVRFLGYYNLLILYIFPAILIGILYIKTFKKYTRGILLIVTSIVSVLISRASTPLGATIIAVCIFILLCVFKKYNIKQCALLFGLFALLINIFIVFVYKEGMFPIIDNFIVNVLHRSTSFTGRVEIWKGTILAIKERPIIGYGYGEYAYIPFYDAKILSHNELLNKLLVGGIIGLLIYIICNIILLKKIDEKRDSIYKAAVISILFGIYLTFITEAYTNIYLYYVVFFLAYNYQNE